MSTEIEAIVLDTAGERREYSFKMKFLHSRRMRHVYVQMQNELQKHEQRRYSTLFHLWMRFSRLKKYLIKADEEHEISRELMNQFIEFPDDKYECKLSELGLQSNETILVESRDPVTRKFPRRREIDHLSQLKDLRVGDIIECSTQTATSSKWNIFRSGWQHSQITRISYYTPEPSGQIESIRVRHIGFAHEYTEIIHARRDSYMNTQVTNEIMSRICTVGRHERFPHFLNEGNEGVVWRQVRWYGPRGDQDDKTSLLSSTSTPTLTLRSSSSTKTTTTTTNAKIKIGRGNPRTGATAHVTISGTTMTITNGFDFDDDRASGGTTTTSLSAAATAVLTAANSSASSSSTNAGSSSSSGGSSGNGSGSSSLNGFFADRNGYLEVVVLGNSVQTADPREEVNEVEDVREQLSRMPDLDLDMLYPFHEAGDNGQMSRQKPKTFLHLAAAHGRALFIDLFCEEFVVNIDLCDDDGMTALHYAAKFGSVKCLFALCEKHRANFCLQDKKGRTPIDIAREKEHTNAVLYFGEFVPRLKEGLCAALKPMVSGNCLSELVEFVFGPNNALSTAVERAEEHKDYIMLKL